MSLVCFGTVKSIIFSQGLKSHLISLLGLLQVLIYQCDINATTHPCLVGYYTNWRRRKHGLTGYHTTIPPPRASYEQFASNCIRFRAKIRTALSKEKSLPNEDAANDSERLAYHKTQVISFWSLENSKCS